MQGVRIVAVRVVQSSLFFIMLLLLLYNGRRVGRGRERRGVKAEEDRGGPWLLRRGAQRPRSLVPREEEHQKKSAVGRDPGQGKEAPQTVLGGRGAISLTRVLREGREVTTAAREEEE